MDAFSGYNQIKMDNQDWKQTAFITHQGYSAFKVMPFGLISIGATFQEMMDTVFRSQIGRNMQVYVDDMIVKTKQVVDHASDLRETFENIRRHKMRLNPAKCSFGVTAGKFLGFLLTQRGIEADPAQIKVILDIEDPKTLKDIQKLTGCIVALRKFIPQSSKQCLPLFQAIKNASKSSQMDWNDQSRKSLDELKILLTSPPILTRALPQEPLRVYLSASDNSVAVILIRLVDNSETHVYYISHTLRDAKTRYPQVEKLVYSLVVASRKLRHYFQGREILVKTNQLLKRILHKPDMTGRLATWTIVLSQFYIEYKPRSAMKSQVLSDFVVECQFSTTTGTSKTKIEENSRPWTMYVDGSTTDSSGAGAGAILINPDDFKIQQAIKLAFPVTNNEAEYEALFAGLRLATELQAKIQDIYSDSQFVVKQVRGEFKTHSDKMSAYLERAQAALRNFLSWTVTNVDRSENQWADALSKLAPSPRVEGNDPVYIE